jgi:hypothetical protein
MAKRKAKTFRLCRHAITCLSCRWSQRVSPETYITIREVHSGPSQEREVFYRHRYCSPSTLSQLTLTDRTANPRKWRGVWQFCQFQSSMLWYSALSRRYGVWRAFALTGHQLRTGRLCAKIQGLSFLYHLQHENCRRHHHHHHIINIIIIL